MSFGEMLQNTEKIISAVAAEIVGQKGKISDRRIETLTKFLRVYKGLKQSQKCECKKNKDLET